MELRKAGHYTILNTVMRYIWKRNKAISTNINDFTSTGITQTSYLSTFPKTNQRISDISRGHHGECHFKDRRARREKGLGMEEGGASAGVAVILTEGGGAGSGHNE